jgi:hypothetical protein
MRVEFVLDNFEISSLLPATAVVLKVVLGVLTTITYFKDLQSAETGQLLNQ